MRITATSRALSLAHGSALLIPSGIIGVSGAGAAPLAQTTTSSALNTTALTSYYNGVYQRINPRNGGDGTESRESPEEHLPGTPGRAEGDAGWRRIDYLMGTNRNEAIKAAINYFGISTIGVKGSVTYDPRMTQEGTTLQGRVRIGPAAFDLGPGWLGSTLGHEMEVHALQRPRTWFEINFNDQLRWMREVEAYDYEISNAQRYNLTPGQVDLIRNAYRKEYYDKLSDENKRRVDNGVYETK